MITDLNRITGKLIEYEKDVKYLNSPIHFRKVYEKIDSLMNDIENIIKRNKK